MSFGMPSIDCNYMHCVSVGANGVGCAPGRVSIKMMKGKLYVTFHS